MKREFQASVPELMDTQEQADAELLQDLQNLETMNRRFGAHRLILDHLAPVLPERPHWHIVDLATGYADIPRKIVDLARTAGIKVTIQAIDANPATVELAIAASAHYPEIEFLQQDILSWSVPTPPDLVLCNLALHHFSDADALKILQSCARLSNTSLLITDLLRSRLLFYCLWLMTTFWMTNRLTRHDALLSVRRGFSHPEFCSLLRQAGLTDGSTGTYETFRQFFWKKNHRSSI